MSSSIAFGQLVGAQVSALIEGEIAGSERTWEFIEGVGFRRNENGVLELQTVEFEMLRRDVDGEMRTHTINIPVLTLVPLPLLTIEEANIEFDLTVEEIKDDKSSLAARVPDSSILRQSSSIRKTLITRLARTPSRQQTKTMADLSVTVRMKQSDLPIGIENLINVADLGLRDDTK